MLLKNAVLDEAISVEIVLGNEGMLGRTRGAILPACLHFLGKSWMIFLATKKATDTEIKMIQSGYRPCTIAAVEVASEVAVSCAIVISIFS